MEVTIDHARGETVFSDFTLIEMRENLDGEDDAIVWTSENLTLPAGDYNAYPKAKITRVEK